MTRILTPAINAVILTLFAISCVDTDEPRPTLTAAPEQSTSIQAECLSAPEVKGLKSTYSLPSAGGIVKIYFKSNTAFTPKLRDAAGFTKITSYAYYEGKASVEIEVAPATVCTGRAEMILQFDNGETFSASLEQ